MRVNERQALAELKAVDWDVIVVGGGITGAGVAREAVRRGLKTLLVEQQDYAWGTSSRSSKMVHGGLRYIASGDIRLTWHSLVERERLLREAPGLVTRLGYWFAHYENAFPGPWVFGLLLRVYDLLARVRDHRYVKKAGFLAQMPGYREPGLRGASRYTDALVDDARLVLRVLAEAQQAGACLRNYTRVEAPLQYAGEVVGVRLRDVLNAEVVELPCRVLINATGAWADRLRAPLALTPRVRPLRGSHLVLSQDRLAVSEAAIFMHPDDGRAVFIYPWEGRTLVGTTDLDHRDDLDQEAHISHEELHYLLRAANSQFPSAKLVAADVLATFSGVRPIVSSGKGLHPSQEKRDHSVFLEQGLVTVTGGKLTTFRKIAIDALRAAAPRLGIEVRDRGEPVFAAAPAGRLGSRFGAAAVELAAQTQAGEDQLLPGLTYSWAELRWSLRHEQVVHLDDLLLRRTRIGLLWPQGGAEFLPRIGDLCRQELGWDMQRWQQELSRYQQLWQTHYSLPAEEAR